MSYFSQFPVLPYDAIGDGEAKMVTNILKRVVARWLMVRDPSNADQSQSLHKCLSGKRKYLIRVRMYQ